MNFLKELYFSQLDHNLDHFTFRKKMITVVFFYIASFILITFTIVNFILGKYALVVIDSIAAVISFYSLYLLQKKENINKIVNISSINIFIFFLLFVHFNHNNDFGLIWTIFLPLFIIPLNGYKKGLIISFVFYFIVGVYGYQGIGIWDDGHWNFHAYIRYMVASIVLVYIIYITELAIYRSNLLLVKKEKQEQLYTKQLEEIAQKDYLTQIYNRRKITQILENEIARAKRYNLDLAVAILDIDFFKKINDTYGHNMGDVVLKEFAKTIQENLRQSDFIGRWGGEEFIVVLTHTSKEEARKKIEQLCNIIRKLKVEMVPSITCSAGVNSFNNHSLDSFIAEADEALYRAKENGRDQVQSA